MSVTRAEFLSHVHQPLVSRQGPSSPTKGKYRLRWRELSEWNDFGTDTQTYWGDVGDAEKNQVLAGVASNYWDVQYSSMAAVDNDTVTQEQDLGIPFINLYSLSHNLPIPGSNDDHARITPRCPANIIGDPDCCLKLNDQLVGIIELKTFWKVTETTILEVLEGLHGISIIV